MRFIVLLLSLFAIQSCTETKAQQRNTPQVPEEFPTLIGGTPANPADWPASVYAHMGNSACSATVVGEQVLIIASHCVSHGGSASFSVGANNYTSTCARSPKYRQGIDHDLALCKVSKKVEGIKYENVNQDNALVKVGDTILLTGYGCIRPGGGGGNDGIYRIGEAKVFGLPSGNNYDIYTKGRAALCYGDSGGSAYVYLDAEKTKRVMISTNSKGDIREESWITSTSTPASVDFIKDWSAQNSVKICGVHSDATGCRGEGENPPPTPPPATSCKDAYKKLEVCIKEDVIFN